jgi:uncharacterized Zn finger protein (UPF0148 family)
MKIVALDCNQCGAALEVGAKTRFATCSYCGTKLQIHHTDSSHFSEVLEKIEATTTQLADDVAELKMRDELDRIDRSWQERRQRYLARAKDGTTSIPTMGGAVVLGLVGSIAGIAWMFFTLSISGPLDSTMARIFPYFGLIFAALALVAAMHTARQAKAYERARRRYEQERRAARSGAAS